MANVKRVQGFVSSLNPAFKWMRLIGIELDCWLIPSHRRRWATASLASVLLALNGFSNAQPLIDAWDLFINDNYVHYDFLDLLYVGEQISAGCVQFGLHLALIYTVPFHWPTLFATMKQIERDFCLNRTALYKKCRKITVAAVAFLSLVIVIDCLISRAILFLTLF